MIFGITNPVSGLMVEGKSMKGLLMSYGIFLLFSSLLLLTYMISNMAVTENDVYSVILSVERVRNQFDAIEYHYLRLPNSELNFTINGSSVIFTEILPFSVTNETSTSFFVFKQFVENYSLINTTFDSVPELPGELRISPQNISVIHPDEYSVIVSPLDNASAATLDSYIVSLEVQGATPNVEWVELHEAETGGVFLSVTANGTGNPGRNNSVSAFVEINDEDESIVLVERGANEIMRIVLYGGDNPGQMEMYLDDKFSANITYAIAFNSSITETVGGQKPANATVTIANVLKRNEIVK